MLITSTPRRWLLLGGAAAVLTALGVSQAAAGRTASQVSPQLPSAAIENTASQTPSVSADGRLVVYAGAPTTPGDTRVSTTWIKDRADGSVYELTGQSPDVRPGE